jgi:hypothetical protein
MSWFVPFLTGMFNGFMQEMGRPATQAPASPSYHTPSAYSFREHMQALAGATGVPVTEVGANAASLSLPWRGETYFGVAGMFGGNIELAVTSKVQFPPGRMPHELMQTMADLNARSQEFEFKTVNTANGCTPYIHCYITPAALTPETFEASLAHMVAMIAKLDAWMFECGLAR